MHNIIGAYSLHDYMHTMSILSSMYRLNPASSYIAVLQDMNSPVRCNTEEAGFNHAICSHSFEKW